LGAGDLNNKLRIILKGGNLKMRLLASDHGHGMLNDGNS
jgi:hypothetical protein